MIAFKDVYEETEGEDSAVELTTEAEKVRAEIEAIKQAAVLDGNDRGENNAIDEIIKKYEEGRLTPEEAVQEARKVLASKATR